MARFSIGLSALVLVLAGCSDDGAPSSDGTTGGGNADGPFVTSQPPNSTFDPPPAGSSDGDEEDGATTDAPGATTEPEVTGDDTTTGAESEGTGTDTTGGSTGDTGGVPAMPTTGDVVITEILQNPAVLMDSEGEWFELHNPSATTSYQLQGCAIEGAVADAGFPIDVDMTITPGGYLVFATTFAGDQGFEADLQWDAADFSLNNASDTVRLVCGADVVDEVAYDDGVTFPDPNGASMSLDPGSLDTVDNDDGTSWCAASSSYNGDLGTPGADNDAC